MPGNIHRVLTFLESSQTAGFNYQQQPPGSFEAQRSASDLPAFRMPSTRTYRPLVLLNHCFHMKGHLLQSNVTICDSKIFHFFLILEELAKVGIPFYYYDRFSYQFKEASVNDLIEYYFKTQRLDKTTEVQAQTAWANTGLAPDALLCNEIVIQKLLTLYYGVGKVAMDSIPWEELSHEALSFVEYRVGRNDMHSWPVALPSPPVIKDRNDLPPISPQANSITILNIRNDEDLKKLQSHHATLFVINIVIDIFSSIFSSPLPRLRALGIQSRQIHPHFWSSLPSVAPFLVELILNDINPSDIFCLKTLLHLQRLVVVGWQNTRIPLSMLNALIEYLDLRFLVFRDLTLYDDLVAPLTPSKSDYFELCLKNVHLTRQTLDTLKTTYRRHLTMGDYTLLDPDRSAPAAPGLAHTVAPRSSDTLVYQDNLDYQSTQTASGIQYLKPLFSGAVPHPKVYRMQVYTDVSFSSAQAFRYQTTAPQLVDTSLPACATLSVTQYHQPHQYHGYQTYTFSAPGARVLVSLTPNDTILAWTISLPMPTATQFKLQYDPQTQLYYLYANQACSVRIDYILQAAPFLELPSNLQRQLTPIERQLQSFLAPRLCAARAALMWSELKNPNLIPCRAVRNEVHLFLELQYQGQWYAYHPPGGSPNGVSTLLPGQHSMLNTAVKEQAPRALTTPERLWHPCSLSEVQLQNWQTRRIILQVENLADSQRLIEHCARQTQANPHEKIYLATAEQLNTYNKGLRLHINTGMRFTVEILSAAQPFSLLAELIQQHARAHWTIIINFAWFTAQQLAQFNTLFECPARLQDLSLPDNVTIIGISIKNRNDFTADIQRRVQPDNFYAISSTALVPEPVLSHGAALARYPATSALATESAAKRPRHRREHSINLYGNNERWLLYLLGRFQYDATTQTAGFSVAEQGLLAFLDEEVQLTILNLPNSIEFQAFWYNLIYLRQIVFQGLYYSVPASWEITTEEQRYQIPAHLRKKCLFIPSFLDKDFARIATNFMPDFAQLPVLPLNPFFWMQYLDMPLSADKHVLCVTHPFSALQWSELLATLSGRVVVLLTDKTQVHSFMGLSLTQTSVTPRATPTPSPILYAQDAYLQVSLLNSQQAVIVLDGLELCDLWRMHPGQPLQAAALLDEFDLSQASAIILLGEPTTEVGYYLQAFLLTRYHPYHVQNKPLFVATTSLRWLGSVRHTPLKLPENYQPYATLQANAQHITLADTHSSVTDQQRINAVRCQFQEGAPVVWLEGPTASAKTSFTQLHATACFPGKTVQCYYEANNAQRWINEASLATPSAEEIYLLIINEGNLANDKLMGQLLSLYQLNSYLKLGDTFIYLGALDNPLRQRLKVLITANPSAYSQQRKKKLPLYELAAKIAFGKLDDVYIEQQILRRHCPELTTVNLAHLRALMRFAQTHELIFTPRDWVTLGQFLSFKEREPAFDDNVFYHLSAALLSEEKFAVFCADYLNGVTLNSPPAFTSTSPEYFLVPSRQMPYYLLKCFLHLAQHSIRPKANEPPQGHLPIFLLEGPTGSGKSSLVKMALTQAQYHIVSVKEFLTLTAEKPTHLCIHLPPSLPQETQQVFFARLLQCHPIPIVWIDEHNTQEIDEQMVNYILDNGVHIFATQNPPGSDYAGRKEFSPALVRRSLKITLPAYTQEEQRLIV